MYMLNLVFDLSKNEGFLSGDDKTAGSPIPVELRKSLNWLKWKGPDPIDPNSPPFDPEVDNWKAIKQSATLLLKKSPGPICIRAMPDPRGPAPAAGAKLQLVVAFGRPARFYQPHASPFTHQNKPNGNVVTTFVKGPVTMNTGRAWWFVLGEINKGPDDVNESHRYEFSVGLIATWHDPLTNLDHEFHYGEDPEMDIEM